MPWRDSIKIHPAADMFPMMSDGDLVALGEDIKRNGLTSPIAGIDDDDARGFVLVDGRNRLDAIERVGLKVQIIRPPRSRAWAVEIHLEGAVWTYDVDHVIGDPTAYIASANIHRRHMTDEQKRAVIAKLLKENPGRSNWATAALARVDHKTVGSVRREMEGRGVLPHVDRVVDTMGRQQPAKRTAGPAREPTSEQRTISARNAQVAATAIMSEQLRTVPIEGFKQATHLIGSVNSFAKFCRSNSARTVAAGILPHERAEVDASIGVNQEWLDRFAVAVAERAA